jgi:hypothetical protein
MYVKPIYTKRVAHVGRFFYLGMSLLIAAIVVYGFGNTIESNLFHPSFPRPPSLYVHAAVFSAWVLFLIVQSLLVVTHHVKWHRTLGWVAAGVGALIPVLGIVAALQMAHLRAAMGDADAVASLIVSLYDMAAFTLCFGLAILWRRRPELHRRLMFIATCGLSVAALSRFPPEILPPNLAYIVVDGMILTGAARDLAVLRRVHPVYLWALPLLIAAQTAANFIFLTAQPLWMKLAYWLIR